MPTGHRIYIILFLIVMSALSCSPASVEEEGYIGLSGQWKLIAKDDRSFAATTYDDSRDRAITIPGEWNDCIRDTSDLAGTIWLRKDVFVGKEHSGSELILDLGGIGVADETFFNGVFIGGSGSVPDSGSLSYGFAWKNPRRYVVPGPLVKYGAGNLIAVRIFSQVFTGITGNPRIIKRTGLLPDGPARAYIPFAINVFALTFNSIFFFIFLVLFAANRTRRVYLYFSLVVLSGAAFNLSVMNLPFLLDGLVRFKFLMFSYVSISFFLALSIQEIFDMRPRYSAPLMSGLFAAVTLAVLAVPTTRALIYYLGPVSVTSVLVYQTYSAFIFVKAVLNIPRKYWLLFFIAPVMFSVLRNTYYLYTMQFSIVQLSIFLHVPVIVFVVTLFFFYDYEYEKRSGESIYQSLLRKSRKLQRDLKKAKKIDARPEPHEMIHRLVDYLDNNFTETYNRKDLSRKFGLNSNYMVQLFKKTTGETISNYINMKRIEKAKVLLRESDNKIIDIAFHIGFENYTHFHRLFKRVTGMTPREYRIYSSE